MVEFIFGCVCGIHLGMIISTRTPRDQDPDWCRSINHENINRPSGPPPLKLRNSFKDEFNVDNKSN